mgnify:CR=1 FL=1
MIGVAVLGFGTVGSGVVDVIEKNRESFRQKAGEELYVKYVLDIRNFPGDPYENLIIHDFSVIENDPEVSIVVETIGGTKIAGDFTRRALNAGKSVVTSNKELVAARGAELLEIAKATTDPANSVYGMAMCCISTEEGTFQMLPWLRSVVDGVGVNVDNLTAPSAVAGLSALAELINSGSMSKECVNWTQADAWTQFCTGKAAMAEIGTWHLV